MLFFTDRLALTTRLMIVACLAASCAAPPPVQESGGEDDSITRAPSQTPQAAWTLRVGVEYLPPGSAAESLELRGEGDRPTAEPHTPTARYRGSSRVAVETPRPLPRTTGERSQRLLDREHHLLWKLDDAKLQKIRDPVERATVRMIHDLMGEDRRRIKRKIGTPILASRWEDLQMPFLPLHLDEKNAQEEDEFMADEARSLLRRPLRNVLKKSAIGQSIRVALEDFKADHVPLSRAYQDSHPGKVKWGRVSLRGHLKDGSDPVEIRYKLNGWRIAASKEKVKAGFQTWLADDLSFEIRSDYDMPSTDWSVRADLVYFVDESTRFHCVAGDNLDFLATSNLYSLFDSPMDGSPGVLFFAVHLF